MDVRFFRVGGCVRDELLGIPSKDIDFAVEAPSFEDMLRAVEARCTKVFLVTPEFFTIRALDPELGGVDFVLCRKDGPSSDGRRPDFVEPGTIQDDLARRDFTVNAMAQDADDGFLIDPFDGQVDLANNTLRFVGKAEDRLAEDALRAFRGIRFEVTKRFHLDFTARGAIDRMKPSQFDAVSTERIREELLRCFAADTHRTLNILRDFPVLFSLMLDRGIWLKPTVEAR